MDRLSFIQQQRNITREINACGESYCLCDETILHSQQYEKISPSLLVAIVALSLFCAATLAYWNVADASSKMRFGRMNNTLSCGTNNSIDKKAGKDSYTGRKPLAGSDGNSSCPHQFNGFGMLCCGDSKRKRGIYIDFEYL